jgi:hypothetical protein
MNRFGFTSRAILPGVLMLTSAFAARLAHAQERGPLSLAQSSYFFVGGKIDTSAEVPC